MFAFADEFLIFYYMLKPQINPTNFWRIMLLAILIGNRVIGFANEENNPTATPQNNETAQPNVDRLLQEQRTTNAEKFRLYHFEPGGPAIDDRDLDNNYWPDFWQKLVDDKNLDYLGSNIRIVEDYTRVGRYPDSVGHVLQIPFDGTGVAIETRYPIKIDPEMAYELTAYVRTLRLSKSHTRVTLQWLKKTDDASFELRGEDHLTVPPGQIDWSETPLNLPVNKVPLGATHLRLNLNIYPDKQYRSADRQGVAWFDDLMLTARPKIYMEPTFRDYTPGVNSITPPPFEFVITYRGLLDNVPEGERKGNIAKSYYRIINIIDINGNQPRDRYDKALRFNFPRRRDLYPGTLDTYPEKIPVGFDKLGVYYLTVTLYGYKGELLTERTQVLGLWQPPIKRAIGMDEAASSGGFGVIVDEIPFSLLQQEGKLCELVERTGARYVKSRIYPSGKFEKNDLKFFTTALALEFSKIRRAGLRITALLEPPENIMGTNTLYDLMRDAPKNIAPYTDSVTAIYDANIENWQWGDDTNPSFSAGIDLEQTADARALLAGRVSSPSQSFPVVLNAPTIELPSPDIGYAASLFAPAEFTENKLLLALIKLLPDYFTRFHEPEKRLYPPPWLIEASPIPEPVDETRPIMRKLEEWLTCELQPTPADIHVPRIERQMLADIARKAVMSRVCGLPRFYARSLLSPTQGLARLDQDGHPIPLPALLGLRVLDEYLTGTTYLGSFNLLNENGFFPNYVFALPDNQNAIVVVWYDGKNKEETRLDFGGGYRLNIVDLQGNIRPLPEDSRFIASRTPQIITGLSIAYARTRMSINILREPPLQMRMQEQKQFLTITNFYAQPITGDIIVDYAARSVGFLYENNWRIAPQKLVFSLPRPRFNVPQSLVIPFEVRPPIISTLDKGQETGEKIANLRVRLMSNRPENMRLLRSVIMHTDIQFTLKLLTSLDDPNIDLVQLSLRWIPDNREPRKNEIILRPFYRAGQNLDTLQPSVIVPAYAATDKETPPITVEYRIPKSLRNSGVWIGFRQEDGTRFLNYNVDDLLGKGLE